MTRSFRRISCGALLRKCRRHDRRRKGHDCSRLAAIRFLGSSSVLDPEAFAKLAGGALGAVASLASRAGAHATPVPSSDQNHGTPFAPAFQGPCGPSVTWRGNTMTMTRFRMSRRAALGLAVGGSVLTRLPGRTANAQTLDKVIYKTSWRAQAEHGGFYQA